MLFREPGRGVAVDPAPGPDGPADRLFVAECPAGGVRHGPAHPLSGTDPLEEVFLVELPAGAGAVLHADHRATSFCHQAPFVWRSSAARIHTIRPSSARIRPIH